MFKGPKSTLIIAFLFQPFIIYSQKGDLILKWNTTKIINPFNSTVQAGIEYFIEENKSVEFELGIKSQLFKDYSRYDKGTFIAHVQLRKHIDNDFFAGFELSYLYAKDYSDYRCMYHKNKKYSADYDSATLIKHSYGISSLLGYQIKAGKIVVDLYTGLGLRLVNNKLHYARETVHNYDCLRAHFEWSNDNKRGTFIGGHFLAGIKIGYLFSKE